MVRQELQDQAVAADGAANNSPQPPVETINVEETPVEIICNGCEDIKMQVEFYCDKCNGPLCNGCFWDRPVHRKENSSHKSISYEAYQLFNQTAALRLTDQERQRQHNRDILTLWFSIDEAPNSQLGLQEYGRYNELIKEHQHQFSLNHSCYSQIVTFIGSTGAGKSTLMRALMQRPWLKGDQRGPEPDATHLPIPGDPNSTIPTSGDVHLYKAPLSELERPWNVLMYADCEGFRGGSQAAAVQARGKALNSKTPLDTNAPDKAGLHKRVLAYLTGCISRKVNLKSDREEAVKELFPRLLYNFSDVVVHVMTESTMREMESELTRLIQWAQNSLHTAVNRAILPRLIVIVNKCPRGVKTWDPIQTTEEILHQQSESVKHNKVMQSYLKMHGFKLEKEEQEDASEGGKKAAIEVNKENPVEGKEEVPVEGKKETQVEGKKEDPAEDKKEDPVEEEIQNPVEDKKEDSVEGKKEDPIATLGSLLGRCYSSFEIIRLPTVDNQDVFSEQLQALDKSIRVAVSDSESQKIASRCWITTEMQSRLFTAAFDHYKESLDKPFDFLESLYSISPVEDSLATSCFELLKQARKAGPGTIKLMTAEEFHEVVIPVLCSMVALDSCRSPIKYPGSLKDRYRGKSIEVHDSHEVGLGDTSTMTYQVLMSKAMAEFFDRACPCEYQDKSGNMCVNSRLSHHNVSHHQNSFGTVIGNGTYESDFADTLLLWWDKKFDQYINNADIKLDGTTSSVTLPGQLEKGDERLTWAAHLKIIQQLYGIMPALNFTGMGICCWCFNKSVILLDCGHDICWKCAQMMGEQVVFEKVDPFFRMYNCNLHPKNHTFERPIYIHLGRPRG